MMKKYFFIIVLIASSHSHLINGQTPLDTNAYNLYRNIPQENIFVHYNASLLFSGDYLYYKLYTVNSQTKKLSQLSKIGYVELIGKDKQAVFKHKIRLSSGTGKGDFFIPPSVPSGNYKLIAYTQWMRNLGDNYYFQADVSIINPFSENQEAITLKSSDSITKTTYSPNNNKTGNKFFELKLKSKTYSKREKVSLQINALLNESAFGNYSISVKKIDSISIPQRPNSNNYLTKYSKPTLSSNKQVIFLPELRGELLSGTVTDVDSGEKVSLKNVSLSISGKNPIFKSSITNDSGVFFFNLDKPYETPIADLHVIDESPEKYKIVINQSAPLNYDELVFSDFKISPEMERLILDRSINNQIENAYSNVKQHKIQAEKSAIPFYSKQGFSYNLDDYTRFKTIKETFVEIIDNAWIEKRNGINNFKVDIDQPTIKSLSPLIIVDGLLVLNHDDLISYDSRKIKNITVVTSRYKYGGNVFEGVLSVETINGDFKNYISKKYLKNVTLTKPQNSKAYFNQIFNDNKSLKHIPDYRSQLFWEPNFKLNKKQSNVTFYTSDFVGNYEINLEGFTEDGIAVSVKELISVK